MAENPLSTLNSLASWTSDTMVLNELFKVINNSFSCKDGYQALFKTICSGTLKAIIVFMVQYLVKNPGIVLSAFRHFIIKLIYRRLQISTADDLHKILKNEIVIDPKSTEPASITMRGLPIYYSVNGSHSALEYCPIIHESFLKEMTSLAQKESIQMENKTTILRDAKRRVFNPLTMFPSNNYKRLDKIIDNFFKVVRLTKMFKAQGILIDGEPGLGKSRSSDYLASLGKYGEICYINLSVTELLKKDFNVIMNEVIPKKITGPMIFCFDELDKFLSYNIEYSFQTQKEYNDFESYRRLKKQTFLYELLEVLETNLFDEGVVMIFFSNNFNTIFEDVDPVHFHSLRTRFAPIRFERCNKAELIEYIRYFNNRVRGSELYYEEARLEALFDRIRDDFSLTYRSINHCHIGAGYDIEKFVELVNTYQPEVINSESPKIQNIIRMKNEESKRTSENSKQEESKKSTEIVRMSEIGCQIRYF